MNTSSEYQQSISQFINACQQLSNPALQTNERSQIETALLNFQNEQNSWKMCCDIMKTTDDFYVLFFVVNTFETLLKNYWNCLSEEEHTYFRDYIINVYFTKYTVYNKTINTKIAKIIAWIAEYQWPTQFPTFLTTISSGLQNVDQLHASLLLLDITVEEFYSDSLQQPFLTARKKEVQSLFNSEIMNIIKVLNKIIVAISESIHSNQLTEDDRWMFCLHIIYNILHNNKIEETLSNELINILLLSIYKYTTQESIEAIKCINEVLSKRLIPLNMRVFIYKLVESVMILLQNLLVVDLDTMNAEYLNSLNHLLYNLVDRGFVILLKNKEFNILQFLQILEQYTLHQPSAYPFLICLQIWSLVSETLFMSGHTVPAVLDQCISFCIQFRDLLISLCIHNGKTDSMSTSLLFSFQDDSDMDDIQSDPLIIASSSQESHADELSPITGEVMNLDLKFTIPQTVCSIIYERIIPILVLFLPIDTNVSITIQNILQIALQSLQLLQNDFLQSSVSINYNDETRLNNIHSIIFMLNLISSIEHLLPSTTIVIDIYTVVTSILQFYVYNNLQMYNNVLKVFLSSCLSFYYSLLRWILCNGTSFPHETEPIVPSLISLSRAILTNDISPFPDFIYAQTLLLLRGIPERLRVPSLWTQQDNIPLFTNFFSVCSNLPLRYQYHLFLYCIKAFTYPATLDIERQTLLSTFVSTFVNSLIQSSTDLSQLNFVSYTKTTYILCMSIPVIQLESKSFRSAYFQLVSILYPHLTQIVGNLINLFYSAPDRHYSYSNITLLFNSYLYLTDWIFNTVCPFPETLSLEQCINCVLTVINYTVSVISSPPIKLRDDTFGVKILRLISLYMHSSYINITDLCHCMDIYSTLAAIIMNKGNILLLNEYITDLGMILQSYSSHKDRKNCVEYKNIPIEQLIESLFQSLLQPLHCSDLPPDTYKLCLSTLNLVCKTSLLKVTSTKPIKNLIITSLLPSLIAYSYDTIQEDLIYTLFTLVSEDLSTFFTNTFPSFIMTIDDLSQENKMIICSYLKPVHDVVTFNQELIACLRDIHILRKT